MNSVAAGKKIAGIFFCYKEGKYDWNSKAKIEYLRDSLGNQLYVVPGCTVKTESQIIDLINRNKGVEV